ncbi:glycosyltransferase [Oleiphilus sp. HI0061]|uniref:glycosyltransferase n=2 Tax=Oleiphilus sp. HI0061 TaxID=1822239 RepID=UPI000A3FA56D|nr:glycosyltransferase [Oleiphilus sp. HI0061]
MITKQKTVIYVGPFAFPNGGAAARRILGISKSLQANGYKVKVASGQQPREEASSFDYEGIEVHSLNERTAEAYPKLLKYLAYLTIGKKTLVWLDVLDEKPDAIILYSGYSPYFLKLLPWCRRNNVPLIFDAVEWYDPPSRLHGILNPYYWNIELAMHVLSPKCGNIIAISRYLDEYYQSKGCNTVRVPPTLDTSSTEARLKSCESEKISLSYTGSPGHKDFLDNVLEALLQLDQNGEKFLLHIAGITNAQLLTFPALQKRGLQRIPECLKCYGVVPQAQAIDIVRNADFSVLLRPNKRYANAGFPTKFVESFSVGTPVIANHTSDLAEYLKDEQTGIVCADESVDSMLSGLTRIMRLNGNQLNVMRSNARGVAESSFDNTVASDLIENLIISN